MLRKARLGFSNNSSSAHSIIYVLNEKEIPIDNSYSCNEFGWDNFILSLEKSKYNYMLIQLKENLSILIERNSQLPKAKALGLVTKLRLN